MGGGVGDAALSFFTYPYFNRSLTPNGERVNCTGRLVEHEFDHVFTGQYEGKILPDPHEVSGFYYERMDQVKYEIETTPGKFTAWFKIAFPQIEKWWKARYGIGGQKVKSEK